MRHSVFVLLRKVAYRFQRLACPNEKQKLYNSWFAVRGDKTLRLDYPLSHDSLVFDCGGYKGQWTADIYRKFGCRVFVFEPVKEYAAAIAARFNGNPHITVFAYGLGADNRTETIGLSDDASSTFRHSSRRVAIEIRDVNEFLAARSVSQVDLVKINIEGGEYELLEALLRSRAIEKINNLQVQFHDFFPDAATRMAAIQRELLVTHELTWQYPFIWENWRRVGRRS